MSRFIPCRVSDILIAEQYPATVTAQFINVSLRGIIAEFARRLDGASSGARFHETIETRIRRKSAKTWNGNNLSSLFIL